MDYVFGQSLHFTGILSSIPEDKVAAVMLQFALGRFSFVFKSFFPFKTKVYILVDFMFFCACSRELWL